jgi:membrane protein DedA with SNARE-associated domain
VGENFQALAEWLSLYGYPVLFLLVFAECAGLPVPGETAVLAASVLASRPGAPLALGGVIAVAIAAAVLGDNLGFWVGRRWARPRLEQGKRFLVLTPKTLQAVEGYFEHYGTLTIFFARFVAGLRVVAALAAGTSRMEWPRFLLANALGAVAWAVTMSLLGYFFGQSWQVLHRWLGRGALLILACAVVLVGVPYLWRHFRLPAPSWDRLLRSQVWHGLLAAVLVVICVAVLVLLAEHSARPRGEGRPFDRRVAAHRVPVLDAVAVGGSYLAGASPPCCHEGSAYI